MFKLLRCALVIGAIFHFSPVRDEGGSTAPDAGERARGIAPAKALGPKLLGSLPDSGDLDRLRRLAELWDTLPRDLRERLGDALTPAASSAAAEPGAGIRLDTLRPEDRRPSWQGVKPPS